MQNGDLQARALAEKVEQIRKAAVVTETPGAPVTSQKDSNVAPPVQATGQRDAPRTQSPGRGSPPAPEQGLLAELRATEPGTLLAVVETQDEDMEDVSGETPNQEETPGAELGVDALAVEEARKR
eukprot:964755-Amphidinium_carterae.1